MRPCAVRSVYSLVAVLTVSNRASLGSFCALPSFLSLRDPLCLESDWPDGQDGPPQSGVAQGGLLISSQDDAEGRVLERVGEERIAGNGRDGTPKRDKTGDEMMFANTQNRLALEPNVTHEVLTRKMCACVRTVRCSVKTL